MSKYKWVHYNNTTFYDVGILPDGTLHNPRGYRPDDLVRAAVLFADERCHERRRAAAKKAAETRRVRHDRRVYILAKQIEKGEQLGPRENCAICHKTLGDPQSIARGIGSECWQGVMKRITQLRASV